MAVTVIPRYAAEALGPNVVLLRDQAVADAIYLVREGIEATNSNSVNVPRFQRLLRVLRQSYTMATVRHSDGGPDVALGESEECGNGADVITIREAAEILDLSERQTLRLAPTLGRRAAGRWMVSRGSVLALRDQRRQERHDNDT